MYKSKFKNMLKESTLSDFLSKAKKVLPEKAFKLLNKKIEEEGIIEPLNIYVREREADFMTTYYYFTYINPMGDVDFNKQLFKRGLIPINQKPTIYYCDIQEEPKNNKKIYKIYKGRILDSIFKEEFEKRAIQLV